MPMVDAELQEKIEAIKLNSILIVTIGDLQKTVDELQGKVQALGFITESIFTSLKAFSDLYLELTDKSNERKFLEKSILKAEREIARTRLPIWFWRHDPKVEIKYQIRDRVKHLCERKYSIDDIWTLTKEFCDEFTPETVTTKQLEGIIEYTMKLGE